MDANPQRYWWPAGQAECACQSENLELEMLELLGVVSLGLAVRSVKMSNLFL
jgi:hypothetical protein